ALRAAGHQVDRVILPYPFTLDPGLVPDDADLVFVGNPTNPTSVAHPRDVVLALRRPDRLVVVDEAFADCLPEERESLAGYGDLSGLAVIRSLTKTWGLAGLRVGYLLAAPGTVRLLAAAQPLWAVSAPALAACVATAAPAALREAGEWATGLAAERAHLLRRLASVAETSVAETSVAETSVAETRVAGTTDGRVRVVPNPAASFVLVDTLVADMRARLLRHGFAVRRGETFPGLGPTWIRVAVRDAQTADRFTAALAAALATALARGRQARRVPPSPSRRRPRPSGERYPLPALEQPARWPSVVIAPHSSQTRCAQQTGSPPCSSSSARGATSRISPASGAGPAARSSSPRRGLSSVMPPP
ncbi:MAG: aminotransferase class I/II-fold pyridoxal phosphate-dependent enzyme, partial [Trebonia sp.]